MPRRIYKIKTIYYRGKDVIKINHAIHANSAVERCVGHMQIDHYNSTVAEVFDSENGQLHAILKRTTKGLSIIFKREVKEGM